MACWLYARYNGKESRVGRFKNREAAERAWVQYLDYLYYTEGHYAVPIYVETGKRRWKRDLRK